MNEAFLAFTAKYPDHDVDQHMSGVAVFDFFTELYGQKVNDTFLITIATLQKWIFFSFICQYWMQ